MRHHTVFYGVNVRLKKMELEGIEMFRSRARGANRLIEFPWPAFSDDVGTSQPHLKAHQRDPRQNNDVSIQSLENCLPCS